MLANRAPSSFQCHGSNNNSSWTLLHSRTGLTSSDYPSSLGTFSFGGGSRESVEEELVQRELNVYPNPFITGGLLNIEVLGYESFSMEIFSLSGQSVYTQSFSEVSENVKLSIGALSESGLYLIKFNADGKQWTQKLVVK